MGCAASIALDPAWDHACKHGPEMIEISGIAAASPPRWITFDNHLVHGFYACDRKRRPGAPPLYTKGAAEDDLMWLYFSQARRIRRGRFSVGRPAFHSHGLDFHSRVLLFHSMTGRL